MKKTGWACERAFELQISQTNSITNNPAQFPGESEGKIFKAESISDWSVALVFAGNDCEPFLAVGRTIV
jgi:hypothetical protein